MLRLLSLVAAFFVASNLAHAAESKARSWNLANEEKARFEAKVVDLLCELSGDCPANCGDGRRQMGLVRTDGKLLIVSKNGQPIFSGAAEDLLPYCGKQVEVDGLLTGDGTTSVYQIQLIREIGAEKFSKANRWSKAWAKKYPEAKKQKGPWFRKDPRIKALIERDGYLGLGLDVDKKFIEEW